MVAFRQLWISVFLLAFLAWSTDARRKWRDRFNEESYEDDDDNDEEPKDHRCVRCSVINTVCYTRVWYPCPKKKSLTTTTTSPESDDKDNSDENNDDNDENRNNGYGRKRRSLNRYMANFYRYCRRRSKRWCVKTVTTACRRIKCYVNCCEKWKLDPVTKTCSVPVNSTTPIDCQNGGTPVGKQCNCPAYHTGKHCERSVCNLDCQNGGMCDIVDGRPKCICSRDFNGIHCQIPICNGTCKNGGECVAEDGMAKCRCREEYTGKNCETKSNITEKDGDCPPLVPGVAGICVVSCKDDSNCYGKKKCCSNGCGFVCRDPAEYICYHNGTQYDVGETFHPDNCRSCLCLNPNSSKPFGGAKCRTLECPPLTNCTKFKKPAASCCNMCEDTKDPVGNYKEPRFVNCPRIMVVLDVEKDKNVAHLKLKLEAYDYRDMRLEVQVSETIFKAGSGDVNFDTVVATSTRDVMGNFARCEFHIRVRDIHPPTFRHCPSDLMLTSEGPVTWRKPTAHDNVGLVYPPRSRQKSRTYFPYGEHPVVYQTEDYEGNVARCEFFIRVIRRDAQHGRDQDKEGRQGHGDKHKLLIIGVGVASVIVLVALIVVIALCCRRARRASNTQPQTGAYDNHIYSIGTLSPPPYKEKPPPYVEKDDPKKEVAPDAFRKGYENPTYVTDHFSKLEGKENNSTPDV